jgi:hypothetical protein
VTSTGEVIVSDWFAHRLERFTASGTFLSELGTEGGGDGQFEYPSGVAVDCHDGFYVADGSNHRIQRFGDPTAPSCAPPPIDNPKNTPTDPPTQEPIDPPTVPENPAGPTVPSNQFQLGSVKLDRRRGAATVTATVPGPGALELAASKRVRGARTTVNAGGSSSLAIVPTKAAKSRLRRSGKAKVEVTVTYTPTGGTPNALHTTVGLVRRGK